MAKHELKNSDCAPGALFVDTTCIDCGTCFHIAPELFNEKDNLSFVNRQPIEEKEWSLAKEAIVSCPTNSIGVVNPPKEFKDAPMELPRLITENIYFCGYTSEDSFGATSYLILHPEGNVLVDSPRFNAHLAKKIEEMGGIKYMFLTHRDDVADHQKFAEHFHCQRIIHANEVDEKTAHCEIVLHNLGEDVPILSDLKAVMTPGHTKGHMVLHYKQKYLFTGDHLFYDPIQDEIFASKDFNWYSWEEQVKSIHKLTRLNFEWIMPGHGGWTHRDGESLKKSLNSIH